MDEARAAFDSPELRIDAALARVGGEPPEAGFSLARWIRQNRPHMKLVLAGNLDKAADAAADLCDGGPILAIV